MTTPQPTPTKPAFMPNDFYESLLERKRADEKEYERSFSSALRLTVEMYAETKLRSDETDKAA